MTQMTRAECSIPLAVEIENYISQLLEGMRMPVDEASDVAQDAGELADRLFSLITGRAFCYLSRKKTERYREQVVASLTKRIGLDEPFRFFYDIGPGYHATTKLGEEPLRFDLGLSELLIIAQVHALNARISSMYRPGVRFWFVIDNVCALRTNDIPLDGTEGYAASLRQLIQATNSTEIVDLIVESETFDLNEYDELLAKLPPGKLPDTLSPGEVENVARFLGRSCSKEEAARRVERYGRTSSVTDSLVDSLVRDVHMTQRATGATLGFRPFPGGDQRTQAGELILTRSSKGRLRPLLLTTRNVDAYECESFYLPELLPEPLSYIKFGHVRGESC